MAKKTTGTRQSAGGGARKKTRSRSKSKTSRKKTSTARAGKTPRASNKKTSKKAAGAKKTRTKAPAGKKKSARKTAKKATSKASKKKAPANKASSRKKTSAKKPSAKRSGSKKPAAKGAPKQTGQERPDGAKPSSKRPSSKRASMEKGKEKGKKPDAPARSNGQRAREIPSLTDARAAASRLAAAAGLPALRSRSQAGDELADDTPRLTKSPLSKRELEKFRKILLLKRAEVAGDVTDMELEALGYGRDALSSLPQHLADQGSDAYDQSLSLGLAASQRELLREIDAALARIDEGAFGICEALGKAINKDRLEATPWSRYSVEGARRMDRGRGRS